MLQGVLTAFLTPDENGNYPTLSKSLSTAKKNIGDDSAEYLERVGADASFIESQRNVKVKLFGGTRGGRPQGAGRLDEQGQNPGQTR